MSKLIIITTITTLIAFSSACGKKKNSKKESTSTSEVVHCSQNINGEIKEGHTAEECEAILAESQSEAELTSQIITIAPASATVGGINPESNTVTRCEFNINGEKFSGQSQEECDQIKEELGIEADNEKSEDEKDLDSNTKSVVQCQYSTPDGVFTGNSQEECDELESDLGF